MFSAIKPRPAFLSREDGAVTAEWVVLSAALCGVAIGAAAMNVEGLKMFGSAVAYALTGESDWEVLDFDVTNGSFENVDGMTLHSSGDWYVASSIDGWSSATGENFEVKNSGYQGIDAYDGSQFLDMNGSPGAMAITQTLDDAYEGQEYAVSFMASDKEYEQSLEVYFGGELVGVADAEGAEWQEFAFNFTAGSGDGSNTLEIREVGSTSDGQGTYIDGIQVIPYDAEGGISGQPAGTESVPVSSYSG